MLPLSSCFAELTFFFLKQFLINKPSIPVITFSNLDLSSLTEDDLNCVWLSRWSLARPLLVLIIVHLC